MYKAKGLALMRIHNREKVENKDEGDEVDENKDNTEALIEESR